MRPSKGTSGYLLDTNVIVNSAISPEKLGKNTKRILTEKPTIYFSPISITEIEIKVLTGKIPQLKNVIADLRDQDFIEKPFQSSHAAEIKSFPTLINHDPYDRMLLAQAQSENLTFITTDRVLLSLSLPWVIDASE